MTVEKENRSYWQARGTGGKLLLFASHLWVNTQSKVFNATQYNNLSVKIKDKKENQMSRTEWRKVIFCHSIHYLSTGCKWMLKWNLFQWKEGLSRSISMEFIILFHQQNFWKYSWSWSSFQNLTTNEIENPNIQRKDSLNICFLCRSTPLPGHRGESMHPSSISEQCPKTFFVKTDSAFFLSLFQFSGSDKNFLQSGSIPSP